MNPVESFHLSLRGLLGHKLRSALTMLGVIFGVAAVIAMLSIGAGARREALEQIARLGMHNILFASQLETQEEEGTGSVLVGRGLTQADARALGERIPHARTIVPIKRIEELRASRGRRRAATTVVATTPEFPVVLNDRLATGAFFSHRDVAEARRVCVLGSAVKWALFTYEEPLGQQVKIGDVWFTVGGVLEPQPATQSEADAVDPNTEIYVPLTAGLHRFDLTGDVAELDQIILHVRGGGNVREAANLASALLGLRHGTAHDFRIIVPEELLRTRQKTQRIFTIVMGAIAGIALLVGGIGIMNIMLAGVLERTREIGVRRTVGATRRDILVQFLFEALLLSFSGGLLGILLGVSMAGAIAQYAHWRTIVEPGSIVLSFGVAAGVGILFGIYPARRAARLDPIESLRYE